MINVELLADSTDNLIDLAQAKLHIKQDESVGNVEDGLINSYIVSARKFCEKYCNRAFVNQTWEISFDYDDIVNKQAFYLPFGKIQEVQSVFFYNEDNSPIEISNSNYYTSNYRFLFNSNYRFPLENNYRNLETMIIVYKVGFGANRAFVPEPIAQAVLLLVANWYENRGAIYEAIGGKSDLEALPFGVKSLLDAYRIYE